MIDGTSAFIQVNAERISQNLYRIQQNSEFEDAENLFEFFPGDTVEIENRNFSDGIIGKIATKLVKAGNWKNRKLQEFIYKGTCGKLTINELTADKYADEIKKISAEMENRHFYPNLIKTVADLEKYSG